ncbi:hypothetical protein C8R46DRAFT_1271981 [Mycena filopes]|nr:hypothetical protein C8R46DRAFT_1271981 [Mycena filopes]
MSSRRPTESSVLNTSIFEAMDLEPSQRSHTPEEMHQRTYVRHGRDTSCGACGFIDSRRTGKVSRAPIIADSFCTRCISLLHRCSQIHLNDRDLRLSRSSLRLKHVLRCRGGFAVIAKTFASGVHWQTILPLHGILKSHYFVLSAISTFSTITEDPSQRRSTGTRAPQFSSPSSTPKFGHFEDVVLQSSIPKLCMCVSKYLVCQAKVVTQFNESTQDWIYTRFKVLDVPITQIYTTSQRVSRPWLRFTEGLYYDEIPSRRTTNVDLPVKWTVLVPASVLPKFISTHSFTHHTFKKNNRHSYYICPDVPTLEVHEYTRIQLQYQYATLMMVALNTERGSVCGGEAQTFKVSVDSEEKISVSQGPQISRRPSQIALDGIVRHVNRQEKNDTYHGRYQQRKVFCDDLFGTPDRLNLVVILPGDHRKVYEMAEEPPRQEEEGFGSQRRKVAEFDYELYSYINNGKNPSLEVGCFLASWQRANWSIRREGNL